MKIIQVAPYYPPYLGGMENVVESLVRIFSKEDKIEIIANNHRFKFEKIINENYRVNLLPHIKIFNVPISFGFLWELYKFRNENIFHVHISQIYQPELFYIFSKIFKKKYIAHFHTDLSPSSNMGRLFIQFYKKNFLKRVLNGAKFIIAPTGYYKEFIVREYKIDPNKVVVIGNPVYSNKFKRKKIIKYPLKLAYVGRINQEKNLDLIFECLNEINGKLYVIGDGPDKKNYENKKIKKVIFLGRLSHQEVLEIYPKMDILVHPSTNESFCLAIYEAICSGLPFVSLNLPVFKSLNHKYGLTSKNEKKDFLKKINKIVKSPKLQEQFRNNAMDLRKKINLNIKENIRGLYISLQNEE